MEAASIACTLARASACSGTALRRNGADSGTLRGASQSRVKSYSPLSPVLSRTGRPRSSDNGPTRDRKSTRLNSSHGYISYAVFCLKKKKNTHGCIVYTHKIEWNLEVSPKYGEPFPLRVHCRIELDLYCVSFGDFYRGL